MLLLGLGTVFLALMLSITSVVLLGAERGQNVRMEALMRRFGTDQAPAAASTAPFAERVLWPFSSLLVRLAHKLSGGDVTATLQRRLDLAGNPNRWTVERVLAAKGLGLVGLGALGLLVGHGSIFTALALGAGAGAAGFFLPNVLLYNAGVKRQQVIQKGLAEALDLLVVSVQAGLGFDAALSQVAKNTTGPLAGEFFRVLQEMQIGKSRLDALRALSDRTDSVDIKHFVGAIVQADSLGVPIARVLREQAKEMRTKRRQRAEEQAQKVPVKILFPLIFFILPALFIVILGPAAVKVSNMLGHMG